MTLPRVYLLFGILLLVATAATELRGWTPNRPDEVNEVPRTVRDNPGSYRPHYIYMGSRFPRGK